MVTARRPSGVTALLDANVLIALLVDDHVHHAVAEPWFSRRGGPFATCPITEGALVRLLVRSGQPAAAAQAVLAALWSDERHRFWPDDLGYGAVELAGVVGHRQVTDAYLAALARHRGGELASFDDGLASAHPDVVRLVPRR